MKLPQIPIQKERGLAFSASNLYNSQWVGKYIGIMKGNDFTGIQKLAVFKKAIIDRDEPEKQRINQRSRCKFATGDVDVEHAGRCAPRLVYDLDTVFRYTESCEP